MATGVATPSAPHLIIPSMPTASGPVCLALPVIFDGYHRKWYYCSMLIEVIGSVLA